MCSVTANTPVFRMVKVKIFIRWSKGVAKISSTYELINLPIFSPVWMTMLLISTISRQRTLGKLELQVTHTSATTFTEDDACRMLWVFFHNKHVSVQAGQAAASRYRRTFSPNTALLTLFPISSNSRHSWGWQGWLCNTAAVLLCLVQYWFLQQAL